MNAPDLPLDGLRVLVTRDQTASDRFAACLKGLGAVPLVCPAIEIRYRHPPGLDEALGSLERFGWLVVTSENAVRAIAARFEQLELDPGATLDRTRIAVVGRATRAELKRLGGTAQLVATRGNASSLAADLEAIGVEGELILFPASRIARPELPRRLRKQGAGVVQLSVYETVSPAQLSVPGPDELDVATFVSPSAVRHVADAVGRVWFRTVPVICIGPTTADAAREAGALEPAVATESSMAGITAALLEFSRRRQREGERHGAI